MSGPRRSASERLWTHPRLSELLPWVLIRTFLVANASIPLMRTALSGCERLAASDPVAAGFAEYLAVHIDEELGHDEQCLEDLEALGIPPARARAQLPEPSLAALLGSQYYWILHHHPITLLGYLATIEGNSVTRELIDRVQLSTGLPEAGFRTLLWHGEHDVEHSAEMDAMADELPLTAEQIRLIGVNVSHVHKLAAQALHEMIALFEEQTERPGTRSAG